MHSRGPLLHQRGFRAAVRAGTMQRTSNQERDAS
jgi:hypothetical protein